MGKIQSIKGRQILDSRGNPTVEVEIESESRTFLAGVPSGASTGSREAIELRDLKPNYYLGKSVEKAVENINTVIKKAVEGKSFDSQKDFDQLLISLDGTEQKSHLGANAVLGASMAFARLSAQANGKSLYQYINKSINEPQVSLPIPFMNVVNGGSHASNNLDIQEFMIVPNLKEGFSRNLRAGAEIFHTLKKILSEKGLPTNVGDEGGFAPDFSSHRETLETLMSAIEKAGYRPGEEISIALDCAASEFYKEGSYLFEGKTVTADELIEVYQKYTSDFPIISIEDGLDENDFSNWTKMTKKLGEKILLVGDDLFVTNLKYLKDGYEKSQANAILIKLNQIGTVWETLETIKYAKENKMKTVISHRSGETSDHFIADLAVGTDAGFIKTGSLSRSDRMSKYNQLLRIEESLSK